MAVGEAEAVIFEALASEKTFETGKTDTFRKIKAALLKRNNAAKQERSDAARGFEPE